MKHLSFLKHIKKHRLPKSLSVGTDCSGIEAPIQALKLLGVNVIHKFSCEIDKHAKASIQANYDVEHIYDSIVTRDHSQLPHVDLYVAGFPCQSFSSVGLRLGFADKVKGTIFFECLKAIRASRPKVFILENVRGLMTHDKGNTFKTILGCLNELGDYYIHWHLYNTKDYGIPQNRPRVYIVGMHKDHFTNDFTKPEPIPMECSLADIMEPGLPKSTLTPYQLYLLDSCGLDLDEPWMVNVNVTKAYFHPIKDVSPCLMATAPCYYYTPFRRRQTPREALRLQGFPDDFVQVVSPKQMIKQAGNSMSTNVLCAIYSSIYECLKAH